MGYEKNLNKNLLAHARRGADIQADERKEKIFRIFYTASFIYALIIDLAFILGCVLGMSAAEETAAGQLWPAALLTLLLCASFAAFLKRADTAGVILSCAACVLQFFTFLGMSGGSFFARHALPLSLLLIFSVLLFLSRRKCRQKIMAEYDRISGALYSAACTDGDQPSADELERIFNAFDGTLPPTPGPMKRSVKARMRKEKRI